MRFRDLVSSYGIELTPDEGRILLSLPEVETRPVGAVRIALEAKAAMTEFSKARRRLYDELASSQAIVHGDTSDALAAGLVIINAATAFVSPTANLSIAAGMPLRISRHDQPRQLRLTVEQMRSLPRRAAPLPLDQDSTPSASLSWTAPTTT